MLPGEGLGEGVRQRESGRAAAREEHIGLPHLIGEPCADVGQLGQQNLGRGGKVVGEHHVIGTSSSEVVGEHLCGYGARDFVEALIRLSGGDALRRFHQHHGAPRRFQTALQHLADAAEQSAAAMKEERDIGSERPGNVGHALVIGRKL